MTQPIFEQDGDRYVATTLARGPWDPTTAHGGAPAALLAAAAESAGSLAPMQVVRLSYDLLRPVPIRVPLRLHVEVVREGRRVQVLEAHLATADGLRDLARCRVLRQRTTEITLPEDRPGQEPPLAAQPEALPRVSHGPGGTDHGFWTAVDVRLLTGHPGEPGVGRGWFRVVAPLTDGPLGLTPTARVAAAADFGNGIGPPLAFAQYRYVNPDLTVHLHRLPVDEWVSLEAASIPEPAGIGLTIGRLGDRQGLIGRCLQSLFIEPV